MTLHSLVSVDEILSDSRCKMELLPDPPMKPFKTEVAFAFTNEKNHLINKAILERQALVSATKDGFDLTNELYLRPSDE